jgi:hypothetical protein
MADGPSAAPPPELLPPEIEIDPAFPAVPLGTGARMGLESAADPETADAFTVRGFIEADSLELVPETVGGVPIYADAEIQPVITCGGSAPVGNAAAVAAQLQVAQLAARGLDGDGVAVAIMDTGINLAHLTQKLGSAPRFDAANSWVAPGIGTTPGNHAVGHGTMCAYDVLIAAPRATLIDFAILGGNSPGGSAMGGSLGVALQAFSRLLSSWAVTFAPGAAGKYKALVVNNSWAMFHPSWDFPPGHRGRYCDNPSHPVNLIVGVLAGAGIDVVFAASNCGSQCADNRCKGRVTQTIMGAAAMDTVLTLAGCDTSDQRVGYSSQGPSIAGMFQQKPDLTAYTHFQGSEAFGAGSADSGTSAACPVAAGCVAALRTRESPGNTPPASLFAQLIATARRVPGQTGWNGDYGHGIIDVVAAANTLGL